MAGAVFVDGTTQSLGTLQAYTVFVSAYIATAVYQTQCAVIGQVVPGRRSVYGTAHNHADIDKPPVPQVGIGHAQT